MEQLERRPADGSMRASGRLGGVQSKTSAGVGVVNGWWMDGESTMARCKSAGDGRAMISD